MEEGHHFTSVCLSAHKINERFWWIFLTARYNQLDFGSDPDPVTVKWFFTRCPVWNNNTGQLIWPDTVHVNRAHYVNATSCGCVARQRLLCYDCIGLFSGFQAYPPKSGIDIRRNFPSVLGLGSPPISDLSFFLHFGFLLSSREKVLFRV